MMQNTGQLVEDINFQRCDLAHYLGRLEQLVFGDRFAAVAAGGVQVDTFDQLHVVQQRVERHEIGETDTMTFGYLKQRFPKDIRVGCVGRTLTATRLSLTSGVNKCFFTVTMMS